jgi:hypothetical protein
MRAGDAIDHGKGIGRGKGIAAARAGQHKVQLTYSC